MPNDFFVHFCWQHNYVSVRHVWKETLVQEVCDLYTSPVSASSYWHLLIGFQSYFILDSCRAFVFFSSPIARELVMEIKKDAQVLPRIGALREVRFFFFGSTWNLNFPPNIQNFLIVILWPHFNADELGIFYYRHSGMWLCISRQFHCLITVVFDNSHCVITFQMNKILSFCLLWD